MSHHYQRATIGTKTAERGRKKTAVRGRKKTADRAKNEKEKEKKSQKAAPGNIQTGYEQFYGKSDTSRPKNGNI